VRPASYSSSTLGVLELTPRAPPCSFHGTDPEPREGLESGHMPLAASVPFSSVLGPESSTSPPYKTLLPPADLDKVFSDALGADRWALVKKGDKPVIGTCGSGMTAAVLWLALQRAGAPPIDIYDEVRLLVSSLVVEEEDRDARRGPCLTLLLPPPFCVRRLAELDWVRAARREQDRQGLKEEERIDAVQCP